MVNSVLGMQSCWEQSIVISIVEIYRTEALMLPAYLSSGTESCGVLLILVFFVGVLYLRFPIPMPLHCMQSQKKLNCCTGLLVLPGELD